MPETLLTPIMDDLRACLCSTLEAAGGPPCFCGLVSGPLAVADFCGCGGSNGGCGQAFIRLDRIYPSKNFPTPDLQAANCTDILAAVLEVGIYRCTPTPDPRTGEMDPSQVVQAALQSAQDAMSVFRAIVCCPAVTRRDHFIGTWLPTEQGACGGGTVPVTVRLTRG